MTAEVEREITALVCKYEGFEPEEITAPLLEAHGWTKEAVAGDGENYLWHGEVMLTWRTVPSGPGVRFAALTPETKAEEIYIATYEPGEYARIYGRKS
jgi:hypothetical protein